MIEKIEQKLDMHVKSILSKPIITNDEFMLIKAYLERLEFVEAQKKSAEERKEHDKKFNALMASLAGGGFNGM